MLTEEAVEVREKGVAWIRHLPHHYSVCVIEPHCYILLSSSTCCGCQLHTVAMGTIYSSLACTMESKERLISSLERSCEKIKAWAFTQVSHIIKIYHWKQCLYKTVHISVFFLNFISYGFQMTAYRKVQTLTKSLFLTFTFLNLNAIIIRKE